MLLNASDNARKTVEAKLKTLQDQATKSTVDSGAASTAVDSKKKVGELSEDLLKLETKNRSLSAELEQVKKTCQHESKLRTQADQAKEKIESKLKSVDERLEQMKKDLEQKEAELQSLRIQNACCVDMLEHERIVGEKEAALEELKQKLVIVTEDSSSSSSSHHETVSYELQKYSDVIGELKSSQDMVQKLESRCNALTDELHCVQDDMTSKSYENSELQRRLTECEQRVDELSQTKSSVLEELQTVTEDLRQSRQFTEECERVKADCQTTNDRLTAEKSESDNHALQLQKTIDDLQLSHQEEMSLKTSDQAQLQGKLDEFADKMTVLENELSAKCQEIEQVKYNIKQSYDTKEAEIQRLHRELNDVNEAKSKLEAELVMKAEQWHTQIATLTTQLETHTDTYEEQLLVKSKLVVSALSEVDRLKAENSRMERLCREQSVEFQELRQRADETSSSDRESEALRGELADKCQQFEELRHQSADKLTEIERLQDSLAALQRLHEEQLSVKSLAVMSAYADSQRLRDENVRLERLCNDQCRDVAVLCTQKNDDEVKRLESDVDKYKNLLSETEEILRDLQTKSQQLETEWQTRLTAADEQQSTAESEVHRLQQELNKLKTKNNIVSDSGEGSDN